MAIDELRKIKNYSCSPLVNSEAIHYEVEFYIPQVHSAKLVSQVHLRTSDSGSGECQQWIYDHDFGYVSMTSELNWICDDAWKSYLGQSMFFVGSVVGTLAFGILADWKGRLPILVVVYFLSFVGNSLTIFARDVHIFSICRLIAGLATDSNFVLMYIIVMEYISPSMRTFGLNLCIGIFYCIGSMVTPWIAASLGSWQLFLVSVAVPSLLVPLFYFLIPESAQWLISQQRVDDAIKSFEKIARVNRKDLRKESIDDFRLNVIAQQKIADEENANLLSLFKTPRLRRNTLILFFKSMVITLCYDAISKNVEGLGLSPFVMFTLSSATIFPACLVLLALQDRIGRKAMASSSLLISGVFTAGTGIAIVYQKDAKGEFFNALPNKA